ncbi:hypothetical protein [uncultured Serinicoccus sp.]|uniref:hypothetical protein n=1 Tax=uncultured Serinicoccus sp. TaxID=735514 RepID=UPI002630A78E|nr:hypothetical protein [uncultured Serinicoccus sp.]
MPTTRAERRTTQALERARRHRLARGLAEPHDGVVTRRMLLEAGLTPGEIATEVDHGAWSRAGAHTLCITSDVPTGRALWWWAIWESGTHSVLDGATALLAAGLQHWDEPVIHVTVPNNATVRRLEGVRHHRLRDVGPRTTAGLRRTPSDVAVVRAARWARTDRQAATVVAMTVQQRLVTPDALLVRWQQTRKGPAASVLDDVIRDVCDGAHSLNELDFAAECRRRGLPEPTRQAVRTGRNGRVYLDVFWEELGVHVEIHGAQHFQGTAGLDDALRHNDLQFRDRSMVSLQIPVLGLRTTPEPFFAQVGQALHAAHARRQHTG